MTPSNLSKGTAYNVTENEPTRIPEAAGVSPEFTLLGGPLHRLGCRVGLVRNGTNTVLLGVAIGVFLWSVLILLGSLQGIAGGLFTLALIAGHVRLLVAIPLFFACETWLAPRMTAFIDSLVCSGIVPDTSLQALGREAARIRRLKESWLAEAVFLLAAVLSIWAGRFVDFPGASAGYDPNLHARQMTLAGQWYWFLCLPIFRFLILRWLWRLALWCLFLRRLMKLNLHLVPTHPDGVAGLGGLATVHLHFVPLVVAISAVISASLAEEMAAGTRAIATVYPTIGVILALDGLLFLGPLFILAPMLWARRLKGMREYMEFSTRYVTDFDTKWLRSDESRKETPLGTSDLQSLADLANSIAVVRGMQWVPVNWHLVRDLTAAAIVPLLPLLLFEYPVGHLIRTLLKSVSGL